MISIYIACCKNNPAYDFYKGNDGSGDPVVDYVYMFGMVVPAGKPFANYHSGSDPQEPASQSTWTIDATDTGRVDKAMAQMDNTFERFITIRDAGGSGAPDPIEIDDIEVAAWNVPDQSKLWSFQYDSTDDYYGTIEDGAFVNTFDDRSLVNSTGWYHYFRDVTGWYLLDYPSHRGQLATIVGGGGTITFLATTLAMSTDGNKALAVDFVPRFGPGAVLLPPNALLLESGGPTVYEDNETISTHPLPAGGFEGWEDIEYPDVQSGVINSTFNFGTVQANADTANAGDDVGVILLVCRYNYNKCFWMIPERIHWFAEDTAKTRETTSHESTYTLYFGEWDFTVEPFQPKTTPKTLIRTQSVTNTRVLYHDKANYEVLTTGGAGAGGWDNVNHYVLPQIRQAIWEVNLLSGDCDEDGNWVVIYEVIENEPTITGSGSTLVENFGVKTRKVYLDTSDGYSLEFEHWGRGSSLSPSFYELYRLRGGMCLPDPDGIGDVEGRYFAYTEFIYTTDPTSSAAGERLTTRLHVRKYDGTHLWYLDIDDADFYPSFASDTWIYVEACTRQWYNGEGNVGFSPDSIDYPLMRPYDWAFSIQPADDMDPSKGPMLRQPALHDEFNSIDYQEHGPIGVGKQPTDSLKSSPLNPRSRPLRLDTPDELDVSHVAQIDDRVYISKVQLGATSVLNPDHLSSHDLGDPTGAATYTVTIKNDSTEAALIDLIIEQNNLFDTILTAPGNLAAGASGDYTIRANTDSSGLPRQGTLYLSHEGTNIEECPFKVTITADEILP